jgi:hypothetical protein
VTHRKLVGYFIGQFNFTYLLGMGYALWKEGAFAGSGNRS